MENIELNLTEQEAVRREKLKELEAKGIAPFGHRYDRTHKSGQIVAEYESKEKEELAELNVRVKVAGRIMTKRLMGKAGFMHIQDIDGKLQYIFKKKKNQTDTYIENGSFGEIVFYLRRLKKQGHICYFNISYPG